MVNVKKSLDSRGLGTVKKKKDTSTFLLTVFFIIGITVPIGLGNHHIKRGVVNMARMTDVEMAKLVDKGRKLKEQIEALEIELDQMKSVIRGQAKLQKSDHFLGNVHFARVSPQTITEVSSKDYFKLMESMGRLDEFFDTTRVLVGDAKKAIG